MGAKVFIYIEDNKCGYTFKNKRKRKKEVNFPPEPYSKVNSAGEEIILTEDERKDWVEAYHQAIKKLGVPMFSREEKVYQKIEEILKRAGSYRFL